MSDRRRTTNKVSLGLLKGKPMSTSVPTFRFHAGGDEIEQIYPEIEEEPPEKGPSNDGKTDTLSVIPPVAPPRSPKHVRTQHRPNSGEVSPVHASLSTGSLSKRSTSMDTGIVDAPGHNSGWGLFTDIRGKIVRTVEEMKNDRQARHDSSKTPVATLKDNTSFSDSEDASSSESNQIPSYNLSTSDSVSQLSGISGMSSLSTTPTTPSALTVQRSGGSGKWHSKFLPDRYHDEDKVKISRPSTPVKGEDENSATKSQRADSALGSVPLVHESKSISPNKRCTSLRSRLRPKISELRSRRKKVCVDSRSNSSLSSALYSADGNETDDDVESGVEALEEAWEDTHHAPRLPSTPLGDVVSKLNKQDDGSSDSILKLLSCHKYSLLLAILVGCQMILTDSSLFCNILIGGALVLAIQEEMHMLFGPNSDVSSMHMKNQPFAIPNYNALPVLHAPVARELISTDNFQGWMNELSIQYDTKTYHISMTESVYVRIDGPCLTLSHARTKVSKRAMWNEPPIRKVNFTDERIFDLRGWQVKLLPEGITRRRQWSKKYPICLLKREDGDSSLLEDIHRDEKGSKSLDGKETSKLKSPLTAAKYAKNSSSTDSLEMLLLGSESPTKVCSKDEKKTGKDNLDDNASDEDCDDSFYIIGSDMNPQNCIFLFARADREKEEWFRRFAEAVRETEVQSVPTSPVQSSAPPIHLHYDSSTPEMAISTMADYLRYMQRFHLENKIFPPRAKVKSVDKDEKKDKDREKDREKEKDHEGENVDSLIAAQEERAVDMGMPLAWLNALVGRVCFDVLRSPLWKDRILLRLQKKLSTLKLPYFMETLTITELDMGNSVPLFHRASQPTIDMRGLWVELDVTYQGSFRMTIESKLNLMKLKRNASEDISTSVCSVANMPVPEIPSAANEIHLSRSPVFDSDLDDSAESSSDDDTSSINLDEGHRTSSSASGKRAGKKLLRMVDKIAASKYFQQATEMKYIKKAMEGVSNTRIMLSVELKGLVGTLVLNLPPPPSDRLWYGFHGNPKLWLSAYPTLGERQVTFTHISNWIEQKLCQEFQKVLVLPNMDDLIIPVMSPEMPI